MSYAEDLIKIRKRINDAIGVGLIDIKLRDFYEATLIQIMNEAERQRQNCVSQAEQLRKQAATLDGQASGYCAQSSIVYNVLNMYIIQAEKTAAEQAARLKEKEQITVEEKANLDELSKQQNKPSKSKKR